MKTVRASRLGIRAWIFILVSYLVIIFLIAALLVNLPRSAGECSLFPSRGCAITAMFKQHPYVPSREFTDDEVAARVAFKEILKTLPVESKTPKIAFMFLTPGSLPFEKFWEKFFRGHEDRFTVYVHSSEEKPVRVSPYFVGRDIRSEKVVWGEFSMVEAERRLLANALTDPDNQQFVLLSDSCVPLRNFNYVYRYLMYTNVSFIDCFIDSGQHGTGRYSEHMLPEVEKKDFRKASQWFSMKRQHAIMVMADSLYYRKFRLYCKMIDPNGIANRSVTHVDWSEEKWHPKTYRAQDITYELLKNITSIDKSIHVTSDAKKSVLVTPCSWNGKKRPCFLFGRKFHPETLDKLMQLFSNEFSFCPVASGHWTRQDTNTCPVLDTCPQSNVSNGTGHWTKAGSFSNYTTV